MGILGQNFKTEKTKFPNLLILNGKRDKSNGHISDEQYQHLQNVWNTFNFNTFEDFHYYCLRKAVLLLAEVIFREIYYYVLKIL